jgi:WD40 repeat protein
MSSTVTEIEEISQIMPHRRMRGHTHWVQGIVHLPDGHHIITCSLDGSLRLWNLDSGTQIGKDWRDGGDRKKVVNIALSPNGKIVASVSGDGTVRLWSVKAGIVIAKWIGETRYMRTVTWSPDNERVVSGTVDGTARGWDVKKGETVLGPIDTGHRWMHAITYAPDGTVIATGGENKHAVKIWHAKTGELLSTVAHDHAVWSLTWTSDTKKLISGSYEGPVRIFDATTWEEIAVLDGHTFIVTTITLCQSDRLFASASWDRTARLWNLDTNASVGPPLTHGRDVICGAFSADGKLLVTGCIDHNVCVWDIDAILKDVGLENLLSASNVSIDISPGKEHPNSRR